jgi:glucose/arabinose dehydrogenase
MLALACLPALHHMDFWWKIPLRRLAPLAVLLAAYGVSVLGVLLYIRETGARAAMKALVITLAVFGLALGGAALARYALPLYLLGPTLVVALILIPLSVSGRDVQPVGVGVLAVAMLGLGAYTVWSISKIDRAQAIATDRYVKTAFYNLHLTKHRNVVAKPATRGGGLEHLGREMLLADGGGLLYALSFDENGKLHARPLPTRVPANREEFAAAFGGSDRVLRSSEYSERGQPRVQTWRFRVADVLTHTDGDALRIYASHHYWNGAEGCFLVRVSVIDASLSALDESLRDGEWRTLYDSSPCLPMTGPERKLGKNPFRGEEIGGKMALLDADTLLLTIGDHGFTESLKVYAQDPEYAYGKTIRIDLNSQRSEIYTLGHRNPQGLYVAPDGRVWMTEHGSQGGDEVNALTPQANYGWPLVTYGTDYGAFAWPLSRTQNRHEGYTQPAYAWVPSIGVSPLTGIERDLFSIWRGDLIAGSLATRSLYRLVVDGDRIVLAEPISIDERVRDILELDDGRLLLWTDSAALMIVEPAKGMSGALSFATQCSGCHQVSDGLAHRIGPDLLRVVGRDIASAPGFDGYSGTLKSMGGKWTRERLDAFLRDPQSAAPGTTMAFPGVQDDAQRAALLDHLEGLVAPARRD